jgi:hypothetical protein
VLVALLFSPYRGLFFFSPVLLLSGFGLYRMWAGLGLRAEAALCGGAFILLLLMNSSFNGWHGGRSTGPRYLIAAVPFLALAVTAALDRLPRLGLALGVLSGLFVMTATVVDPQLPEGFDNPTAEYLWPLLAGRTVTVEAMRAVGPVSANPVGVYENGLAPLFPLDSAPARWNSFNAGEFLFPGSLVSVCPLLGILVGGLGAVWWVSRERK